MSFISTSLTLSLHSTKLAILDETRKSHTRCRKETQSYIVYTFGSGKNGQLGLGPSVMQSSEPRRVRLEGVADNVSKCVFSGPTADHSFVIVNSESSGLTHTVRNSKRGLTWGLTLDTLRELTHSSSTSLTLETTINRVFAHAACLNASFLSVTHWYTDVDECGVNLEAVREAYTLLLNLPVSALLDRALNILLINLNSTLLTEPEQLRFYLVLLEYPPLTTIDKRTLPLVSLLARSLHLLNPKGKAILLKWWSKYVIEDKSLFVSSITQRSCSIPLTRLFISWSICFLENSRQPSTYLQRLVLIFKGYLSLILQRKIDSTDSTWMELPPVLCNILKDLCTDTFNTNL